MSSFPYQVGGCLSVRHACLASAAAALLSGCATKPDGDVIVRHFPSTVFHEGAPFHVFVFDPDEPRPLDERIRLARTEIEAESNCRWLDVPAVVIAEATARQGPRWAETMLAAPVECRT